MLHDAEYKLYIAILQAVPAVVLGLVASWIAYQQWRAAIRKLQIDLFDRRYDLYENARIALAPVLREGRAEAENIIKFKISYDKARFLFGKEVVTEFDEITKAIAQLSVHTAMMKDGPPYDPKHIEGRRKHLIRVSEFHTIMPILFEPYMKIDQRSVSIFERLKINKLLKEERIRADLNRQSE